MEAKARIEDDLMPQRNCDAKDEMNLAEFPLCALAHRLSPEVKTLRFQDRIWDKGRNQAITRSLTITGSDAYGLPTEKDDEVLLGLIQLTRARGFTERKVPFTRHELIQILGWRDDSKSYTRIAESLNRWTGVTLYYDNAWWNKDRRCWMKESFHILENVWLCHRGQPTPDTGLPATGTPQSAFVWNETIFRSFTHGNLKSIDFGFYKSLTSAIAKRLYRFLDKHFYKRNRLELDLRELCCEHVGLSRNYDTANLKRKLMSGVRELEMRGFLNPVPKEQRILKLRPGIWKVQFERCLITVVSSGVQLSNEFSELAGALIERGINPSCARGIVVQYPAECIKRQLEYFDRLYRRKDPKVSRNPAGFLISSIRCNYSSPNGRSRTQPQSQTKDHIGASSFSLTKTQAAELSVNLVEQEKSERFWHSLTTDERKTCEEEAFKLANPIERTLVTRGGVLAKTAKQAMLRNYALRKSERSF